MGSFLCQWRLLQVNLGSAQLCMKLYKQSRMVNMVTDSQRLPVGLLFLHSRHRSKGPTHLIKECMKPASNTYRMHAQQRKAPDTLPLYRYISNVIQSSVIFHRPHVSDGPNTWASAQKRLGASSCRTQMSHTGLLHIQTGSVTDVSSRSEVSHTRREKPCALLCLTLFFLTWSTNN